ncbi:isoleucine--tRNA ligase [Candidatus Gracilibacteria bacterium]|nr:isoleucine--tRNA ligase [Candidatus Gracilibacteria bacterium]
MAYPQVNPKQSFPELEEKILKFWKENKVFEKSIESRSESNPYRFYDGPPFITGTPHYGSLLPSVCKDVVPRYWTMKGKKVERVWGWDCHGIPIENAVQKILGIESNKDIEKIGMEKFTEECYKYTRNTSAEWEWYIDHIGRWVDFKNSYKTMDQDYMESTIWVFKQLWDKGLVYKGKRVSLYSTKLSTPISNFEVAMDDSYEEVNDLAITVVFDLSENGQEWKNTNILAWTTTPWTIPVNIGLAINKNLIYSKIKHAGFYFIVAKPRIETVFKGREYEVVEDISGEKLLGLSYIPPFSFYKGKIDPERNFRIYHADFITNEDGTGIAHQSPEFGDVDFQLAKETGMHITNALDDEGKYTAEISDFKGIYCKDANSVIIEKLKEMDKLFAKESITHRVAICPRTGIPLIYKVQDSWFLNIQDMKKDLLNNNEHIYWFPAHLKHGRFAKNIEAAPDWCLSRTRYWATPMPVWIGYDENGIQKDMKIFGSKDEIEKTSGMKIKDFHRPYIDEITWKENGLTYKRVSEVLDGWLDSSSMPYAQVHYPFENKEKFEKSFPADFIVEYVGQVRAWFYVMHVISTALFNKPSFKNVITTGVIYGSDGRKMSKSYKNYPDPKGTLQKFGGDAMRFYMINSPLLSGGDVAISEDGINESVKKILLPFWNTYSFFTTYANIDNFKPEEGNIYFVRHGESELNKSRRLSDGHKIDDKLSEEGEKQAKILAEKIKNNGLKFDVIITSPLLRTKQTAEIIKNNLPYEVEIIEDESFIEHKNGIFSGKTEEEIMDYHIKSGGKKGENLGRIIKTNALEIIKDFEERAHSGYKILQEKYKGKNILLVSHGGVFRALNKYIHDLHEEKAYYIMPSIKNAELIKLPNYQIENLLDKWILSQLNLLIENVSGAFESYDLQSVTKSIFDFMDNLTNWYIRRSRRRFWKSENDSDKIQAYNTLYNVLIELCKITAPIIPFISEEIYKNLTGKESVHLEFYPEAKKSFVFNNLSKSMERTQQIINLGLALRANKKIRVRQPLASVTIGEELDSYYKDILKEELNVKEVIILKDLSLLAKKICKPNARLIGPRFGSNVQQIIKDAKEGNFEEKDDGKILVGGYELNSTEYEIAYEPVDTNLDIQAGFGTVIAMDTNITEELKIEGFARDIVRIIQDARKEVNYSVEDRIKIYISGDNIRNILQLQKDYIEQETLSKIVDKIEEGDIQKEEEIDELKIKIVLEK